MNAEKKEKRTLDLESAGALVDAEAEGEALGSWEESDRDYTYGELLDRVYGILREKNPELTGEKRRTILKPPDVSVCPLRSGNFAYARKGTELRGE